MLFGLQSEESRRIAAGFFTLWFYFALPTLSRTMSFVGILSDGGMGSCASHLSKLFFDFVSAIKFEVCYYFFKR